MTEKKSVTADKELAAAEDKYRKASDEHPDGPNSDAVKWSLRQVASAFATLRQTIRTVAQLDRGKNADEEKEDALEASAEAAAEQKEDK